MKRIPAAGTALIALALAGAAVVLSAGDDRPAEVARFRHDAGKARIAIISYFIDDCNGLQDFPGNVLPPTLTTPIAYLTSLPTDPFDPDGGVLRFIQTPQTGNSAQFLIVSRGPDGDWDIDKMRERREELSPTKVTPDIVAYTETTATGWTGGSPPADIGGYARRVWRLRYADGREVDVPKFSCIQLGPASAKRVNWSPEQVIGMLALDHVAIYDPTNGATSDGDLIQAHLHWASTYDKPETLPDWLRFEPTPTPPPAPEPKR